MNIKNKIISTHILLTFLFYCSCNDSTSPEEEIDYKNITEISYSKHVQTILDEYREILTTANLFPPGLEMDSWENLIKGWERGEVLIPFDSENSLLLELTTKLEYNNKLREDKLNLLERWIDQGAKNDNGDIPFADSQDLLYVCSQGEAIINIIDINSLVVIRNIKLTDFGLPAVANPHHIALSPNGLYFYISCIDNRVNKILKFDRVTNEMIGEATTDIPALLDHHPSENILYVSRFMLNNVTNSIFILNTETMQPGFTSNNGEIILPPGFIIPHAIKVDKNGDYVYTSSFSEDQFVVINHATKEFEDAIYLGNDRTPLQVAVSPDNSRVFVSCIGTGEIVVINVNDPNNRFEETAVSLGGQPWHGDFSNDGTKFYVGNLKLNNFSVINTTDFSFQTIGAGDGTDGLAQPHGIAISGNTHRVFISNRNSMEMYSPYYDFGDNSTAGTVIVVNITDNSIEKVIEIENFGSGMRLWEN
jgi:DNA-binding beta-propeller fold protein YncE